MKSLLHDGDNLTAENDCLPQSLELDAREKPDNKKKEIMRF